MSRPGFHPITPYATVPQAGELIDFLKNAFGAKELFRGTPTPNAFQYYVPNADEVYARALASGATALTDMIENHGDRCAAVKDPFGNDWYIGTHLGRRYVPEGLRDVTIYLHPLGAAKPVDFLKAAFAAEEFTRYDSPHSSGMLCSRCPPESTAASGAVSLSEPAHQPYGDRLAGVRDFCGNQWYIATHIGDVS